MLAELPLIEEDDPDNSGLLSDAARDVFLALAAYPMAAGVPAGSHRDDAAQRRSLTLGELRTPQARKEFP